MIDEERIVHIMLNLGIKVNFFDGRIIATFKQFDELQRILKDKYGIKLEDALRVNQNETDTSTSKLSSFIHFNKPTDGKAKRRERRRKECIKNKKKIKHIYNNDGLNFDECISKQMEYLINTIS